MPSGGLPARASRRGDRLAGARHSSTKSHSKRGFSPSLPFRAPPELESHWPARIVEQFSFLEGECVRIFSFLKGERWDKDAETRIAPIVIFEEGTLDPWFSL